MGENKMFRETVKWESMNRECLHQQIVSALKNMPEELRQVFVLRHYEGLSNKELALKMGVANLELTSLLVKANSAFRAALEEKRAS
jgi:DNA-directed RNA polymerase specialized sigma24 family protein